MLTDEQIKKIAREYNEKGCLILAKEMNISKQRISQIIGQFRQLGVNIPHLKRRGRMMLLAEELKKELNV